MLEQFKLENLHEVEGGKVEAAFARHIKRAADDCRDRPFDSKARTVTMQIEITPKPSQEGDCDEVDMVIQVSSKVPPQHTKPINVALYHNGALMLNLDSPDDVDQKTIM